MKLFSYEGYSIRVDPEALLLKPIKKIWDKYKDKDEAMQVLGFIYFYCDPRSDYMIYEDEDQRISEIIKGEGMSEKFKIDKDISNAIEFYSGFKPASIKLLDTAKKAAEKLRRALDGVDLENSETSFKDMRDYMIVLQGLPNVVKALDEAEKAINTEMQNAGGSVRGSAEKTIADDGFDDIF